MVVSRQGGVASKEHPVSPGSNDRKPKGIRSKEGCLTCRIRRKKCDQGKHEHSCESCRRLHIECLGYSRNRPEWLKGAKVEVFKRMIKRFLAENSPKSGVHARQDTSVPVPFLSFESLRGHNDANPVPSGPSGAPYVGGSGLSDSMALDDSEGSDEEVVHYQLQPLTKKDGPVAEQAASANQHEKSEVANMEIDELAHDSESVPPPETSSNGVAQADEQKVQGTSVPIDPAINGGAPAENPELVYYVNVAFPVLHELAGFNLSSHELLAFAYREEAIRNVVIAQAKHHQNRMRFLTSTEDPHHPSHRELCHELTASHTACINALTALRPSFEQATVRNDTTALAVHFTLLHFGGLGDLVSRHSSRRGTPGAPAGTGSSLIDISCRWLTGTVNFSGDLASALRRGGDRQRALIQVAIHIDIFSAITLSRPPALLDAYRAAFKHADTGSTTDSNGVRVAVEPRIDDLLDIPSKTLLALAETAAMASWKAEHVRQGSLSVMDLSRWAKRIDALLVPPSPESLIGPSMIVPGLPGAPPPHTKLIPVVAPMASAASPTVSSPPAKETRAPSHVGAPANGTPAPGPTTLPPTSQSPARPSSDNSAVPVVEQPDSSTRAVDLTDNAPISTTPSSSAPTAPQSQSSSSKVVAPPAPSSPADLKPPSTTAPSATAPDTANKHVNGDVVAPPTPTRAALPTQPHDPRMRPSFRRTLPPATREVFRCAARVFLHSILSGERPRVHDIIKAVGDTCGALRELGLSYLPPGRKATPADDLRFPVVRGLPFCIFIAGCLAGSMEQGMFLRSCLRPVVREVDMQTNELLTA
ncbi:hypothetical protein FRC12_005879, partial [Ceratobasidium sp. 428]